MVVAALTFFYRRAQPPQPKPGELFGTTGRAGATHLARTLFALVLGFMAVVFAGFIVAYVVDGLNGGGRFPFVANSVTKDGLFLAITLLAVSNLRRFGWMTLLVIMGHVC